MRRGAAAATWQRAGGLALALCAVALSLPPWRALIEQSMVWHMVVQMPLLLLAGAVLAAPAGGAEGRLARWNRFGLTGFIAAQAVLAYWMLPLAIDRAVVLPGDDLLKLVSLIGTGALLRRAWRRAPAPLQLFAIGYAVSMLVALGTYLATTDRRLCNVYSLQSQVDAGWGLALLGITVGLAWALGEGGLGAPPAAAAPPAGRSAAP